MCSLRWRACMGLGQASRSRKPIISRYSMNPRSGNEIALGIHLLPGGIKEGVGRQSSTDTFDRQLGERAATDPRTASRAPRVMKPRAPASVLKRTPCMSMSILFMVGPRRKDSPQPGLGVRVRRSSLLGSYDDPR